MTQTTDVFAQAKGVFHLLPVTVEGSWEGRVFDERELKFEVGDGESLGLPAGVEKAITAMEQDEEALFTIKPKCVCFNALCCAAVWHHCHFLYGLSSFIVL